MSLTSVTLKGIVQGADFRRSEATLWDEFRKKYPLDLTKNQCVLFVSASLNQMLFIFRMGEIEGRHGVVQRVVDSRRWRVTGGTWSPDMLQNYAESVGLHLVGIKRFEELYADRRLAKQLESVAGYERDGVPRLRLTS